MNSGDSCPASVATREGGWSSSSNCQMTKVWRSECQVKPSQSAANAAEATASLMVGHERPSKLGIMRAGNAEVAGAPPPVPEVDIVRPFRPVSPPRQFG